VTDVEQRTLLAPDDGSLGPLLRVADDRLPSGSGYGSHTHRAVDVVAIVLAGTLRHRWGDGALMVAGDVAVLRSGAGLDHDEIAGDDGARVLQCYLRAFDADAPPRHEVHRCPAGWVVAGDSGVALGEGPGRTFAAEGPVTVLVWQLDAARPTWAQD
jgi:redox-sensitive bicupin YhaK (pirin superfamily)